MNNKKTKTVFLLKIVLLAAALFPSLSTAEVQLKDASEVIGTWLLQSVSPSLTKPKIAENRVWEFRADGVVVTSGFNRHFSREDSYQFNYAVVNGRILADTPGRPGKKDEFIVHDKTADSMVLQGGMEGYYFFKKK